VTPRLTFDVAIVGGGASGTLLAIQLLRRASPRWRRLLLVDRSGDFARGIAYRTQDESHVLNVPAARMSALPDEEDHFLEWLRRHEPGAGPDSYARRHLYGDYLSELLSETERAVRVVKLERRPAEVQEVEEVAAGVRLHFASGPSELAHRAVLALGNPLPKALPASRAAAPRVWQSPWPVDAVWPPKKANVLLVGAGLTAIDWVVALSARGHQGTVHLLSRHGLLPNPQPDVSVRPLEFNGFPLGRIRPLVHAVRMASIHAGDWRAAVDGVRPVAHQIWRSLGDVERRRFERHVRTRWEVLRHRVAPLVAARITRLRAAGQLRVHAGRLLGIARKGTRLEACFRPRGAAHTERLQVDLVVNCTGPVGHAAAPDALVSALLKKGRARPGPLGLGLATDARGALLDDRSRASTRLWTLGPVRRGDFWESTAVPDIRVEAAALAEQLARASYVTGQPRRRPG
jgi:uncharacterized NAD(P)/FAD-binding protein YdhS